MATNNMINTPKPFSVADGGTGLTTMTDHGIMIGQGTSSPVFVVLGAGQVLIGTTALDPVAATLTAGTGVTITSTTGSIVIDSTGGGLSWSTVTGATLAAAVNNGYVMNHAATPCVVTLPATAPVGSKIVLRGLAGSGGWTATANTGQTIQFGNQSSSSAGSWSSANAGDTCDLECIVANTTWILTNCVSAGLTVV